MTHFFTKYFTYHKVRWDDKQNTPAGKMEKKISKLLGQKVTWSAPHVGSEGKKTWIDITSDIPAGGKK
jgi:hypothetical protein